MGAGIQEFRARPPILGESLYPRNLRRPPDGEGFGLERRLTNDGTGGEAVLASRLTGDPAKSAGHLARHLPAILGALTWSYPRTSGRGHRRR